MTVGKYDGLVLGSVAGVLIAFPESLATTIKDFFVSIIPTTWNWFGDVTIPVLIIGAGALIGLIVDRTR